MDRLRKWFGGSSENDREKQFLKDNQNNPNNPILGTPFFPKEFAAQPNLQLGNPEQTSTPTPQRKVDLKPPNIPADAKVTETRVDQLMQQGRELLLRVVPLEEGDCLSCKLIGTGVLWGSAAFVLLSSSRVKKNYTGFKRIAATGYTMSLVTGLTVLGYARLFDTSIFSKPDEEGNKKSFVDLVQEDIEDINKWMSKTFPSKNNSEKKDDS